MKGWFMGIFLLFLAQTAIGSTGNVFPYPVKKVQLKNGFTAYLIPMEGSEQVSYYSVVRTGSRDEWEPGHSGFAHFFEHMMFRGTKRYPGNMYDKLVTEMGADANAYTTDDYTCYHLTFPALYLEKVMDLESDRFQNLYYEEPEFKTEAGAVYGEYRKGIVNPFWLLEEKLYDLAFEKHTYKHTTIGFEEDIKRMPEMYEYSLSFFKRYYRPENVVLVIAGKIDPVETEKLIEKYYGNWKPGYVPPRIEAEPEQKAEKRTVVYYDGKTKPILAIAFKSDAFRLDDPVYAAAVLLGDLAFGETSKLYRELVLEKQWAEFVYPSFGLNRDPNLFSIMVRVSSEENLEAVEKAILQTIAEFQQKPVEQEQLEKIKKNIRYGFAMSLETPDQVAGRLARFVALTGDVLSVNQWFNLLEKITPEDVQKAAGKYLTNQRKTTVILKQKGEK